MRKRDDSSLDKQQPQMDRNIIDELMNRSTNIAVFGSGRASSMAFENLARMSEQLEMVRTLSICKLRKKKKQNKMKQELQLIGLSAAY